MISMARQRPIWLNIQISFLVDNTAIMYNAWIVFYTFAL